MTQGAFAQGTREGRLDPPSGAGADHVLEERARQVLQSLGRQRHRGRAPGVDLDGLPDTTTPDQGVAVAEQDLVARSLLLQTSLVQLDRQVVVAGGERLLGELRHRAPFLALRHSPGIETACARTPFATCVFPSTSSPRTRAGRPLGKNRSMPVSSRRRGPRTSFGDS